MLPYLGPIKSCQMKNVKRSVLALLFLSTILFVNCTPDMPYVSTTKEVITQGKWAVDYYYFGQDKTSQFDNYEFTFATTGILSCNIAGTVHDGTWVTFKSGNTADVLTIALDNQQPNLAELNANWTITSINLSVVAMKNGSNTQLIFRKL